MAGSQGKSYELCVAPLLLEVLADNVKALDCRTARKIQNMAVTFTCMLSYAISMKQAASRGAQKLHANERTLKWHPGKKAVAHEHQLRNGHPLLNKLWK